jgi:Zn-dependent protease with chaperone function
LVGARYFDGVSSRAHAVRLGVEAGHLVIRGDGVERRVAAADVAVSEPHASGLRVLELRDGGTCEALDAEVRALLDALALRDSAVVRAQRRWSIAIAATAMLALLVLGAWRVLPWVAEQTARALPEQALARIGREALTLLDRTHFEPSEVPAERQGEIRARLAAVAGEEELPAHEIAFRRSPRLGANALAFPNGHLVLTDALVDLAAHDDELVGVLAHEIGHLAHRHSLRSAIQSSAVAAAFAIYLGDVSSLGAGLSAFLIQAKYSRDFEREADAWAASFLRRHEIDPARLADILGRMEQAAGAANDADPVRGYVSTHPVTEERIREILAP